MTRYFLHIRGSVLDVVDSEGGEFPNLTALKAAVLAGARELLAADLAGGVLDLSGRIDAEDAQGLVVLSVPFSQAARIIAPLTLAV